MRPSCVKCKKDFVGDVKFYSNKKKVGRNMKNVVSYYCEECFEEIEKERSWDVYREKEAIIKKQTIRRAQRKSKQV